MTQGPGLEGRHLQKLLAWPPRLEIKEAELSESLPSEYELLALGYVFGVSTVPTTVIRL